MNILLSLYLLNILFIFLSYNQILVACFTTKKISMALKLLKLNLFYFNYNFNPHLILLFSQL